ncbi:MAG TPA: TrkA family potassium uptake protein [Candidatus Limnocylindrales bacterium]|nr:TrkA family potassium uptake protein [Candidatus Limnocylindrales bacterium]
MFVLVIGGGKIGGYLGGLLLSEGYQVKIIEAREEHVAVLRRDLPPDVIVHGNGTEPALLERCGILQAQVVAAVTGNDETNLVVTNLARLEFGVPRTIARVNNPKNAWMFTPVMGVDVALNQADLIARLIAEEMSLGDMMTLLKLQRGQYSLVEQKVKPDAQIVGKRVDQLGLPTECLLTGVLRAGALILPHGGLVVQGDDELIALVHVTRVQELHALLE